MGSARRGGVAGGIDGLIDLVDRFGPEIEYDLHNELGLDLIDWFRGRHPWGKLIRLLSRLPDHGQYKAAAAHDTSNPHLWDLAALLVDDEEKPPTLLGWTREYAMLVAILEAVHQISGVLIAVNTSDGNMPDTIRIPRPVTELQKAKQRQKSSDRSERLRQLIPHAFDQE